jgi:ubiquinone/menaquinone biosynthesis C-methylase UbiE
MIKEKLLANFAYPQGLLGRLAGRIMATKKSNTERGLWAVDELDVSPDSRVLEVGYGPGVTIAEMAKRVTSGHIVGVDRSDVMLAQARRRNRSAVASGNVELRVGDAQQLDSDLTDFDLILGINVWQFWTDQMATIAALADRLAPGGRLAVVYMQPPTGKTTGEEARSKMQDQFGRAGLAAIEVRTMTFDPPAVMMIGHR